LIIITLCNHGFQVREAEKEASKLQRARYNERKGLVKRTERLVSDGLPFPPSTLTSPRLFPTFSGTRTNQNGNKSTNKE
jgi:hypothetical protein